MGDIDPSAEDPAPTSQSISTEKKWFALRASGNVKDWQLDTERQKIRHRTFTFYFALACVALGYLFAVALFMGCVQPSGIIAEKLDGHTLLIMVGVLLLIPTAILLTLVKDKPSHDVESPMLIVGKELVEVLKTWISKK
jgi:hypothetical protein